MRSVVHKSFAQVRDEGVIRLFKSYRPGYADGEQKRDFLYVKDAVKMTLAVAENRAANGLFNIGSGSAHSWNQLATAVFKALQREPNIDYIEMPEVLREKYQYYTCAEIGKLRAAGYTDAITPLEEAVRDYVAHYLIPNSRLGEKAV
jgi:ADP-L-glycero-D-manno-heptose 6-epimerase